MRHYTCDLCGETVAEDRFVVQMEVFATFDPDELVEATPKNIRLRKRILDSHERKRAAKNAT